MKDVLFHTFTTDGYIAWAELYLESLRYVYGGDVNVRMDALNLSDNQIAVLKKINSRLDLRNIRKDYRQAAEEVGVDVNTFQSWKAELESGKLTDDNYLFKIYISVNQRYRNMQYVIEEAKNNKFKYLIHSDIDAYFRKNFDGFLNTLNTYDFAAYFRNKYKNSREKILGAFLAFNLEGNIDKFVAEWMRQIDAVQFRHRWRGFGQSALWYATENTKNDVKIINLSAHDHAPVYSQMFKKAAHFWLGSNSISSRKDTPLNKGWKDFKKGFPRIKADNKQKNLKTSFFEIFNLVYDVIYMLARRVKRKLLSNKLQ